MTDRSSASDRDPARGAPVRIATPRTALAAAGRFPTFSLHAPSLLAASLLAACATTVPRYDYRPPGVRLEARGLEQGDVVLRPGSRAVERELGAGEAVELAVVAADGGGVRRVALVGRVTVGCWNPDTGAQTLDVTEVAHQDEVAAGPGGTVRTSAQVSRIFRVSDYRVTCAGAATTPWVEGTFHGEAEDFHGRWTATGSFTFWFGVEGSAASHGTAPQPVPGPTGTPATVTSTFPASSTTSDPAFRCFRTWATRSKAILSTTRRRSAGGGEPREMAANPPNRRTTWRTTTRA